MATIMRACSLKPMHGVLVRALVRLTYALTNEHTNKHSFMCTCLAPQTFGEASICCTMWPCAPKPHIHTHAPHDSRAVSSTTPTNPHLYTAHALPHHLPQPEFDAANTFFSSRGVNVTSAAAAAAGGAPAAPVNLTLSEINAYIAQAPTPSPRCCKTAQAFNDAGCR